MLNNCVHRARFAREVMKPRPAFSVMTLVVVIALIGLVLALMLPSVRSARPAALRTQCKNNLRNIVLAMHNYHDVYHAFPPAYTVDAAGRPLHSWRTLILPYLDQRALYKNIDLSKPWNHPVNAAARESRVGVYSCPSADLPVNYTTYLAVVGSNTCLQATKARVLSEIPDGRRIKIMVIEVDSQQAVPWMAPSDADEQLVLSLGRNGALPHGEAINAAMADGTVYSFGTQLSPAERRMLVSIAEENKSLQ
jgi:type II secretory pathway pseudopilin PulG